MNQNDFMKFMMEQQNLNMLLSQNLPLQNSMDTSGPLVAQYLPQNQEPFQQYQYKPQLPQTSSLPMGSHMQQTLSPSMCVPQFASSQFGSSSQRPAQFHAQSQFGLGVPRQFPPLEWMNKAYCPPALEVSNPLVIRELKDGDEGEGRVSRTHEGEFKNKKPCMCKCEVQPKPKSSHGRSTEKKESVPWEDEVDDKEHKSYVASGEVSHKENNLVTSKKKLISLQAKASSQREFALHEVVGKEHLHKKKIKTKFEDDDDSNVDDPDFQLSDDDLTNGTLGIVTSDEDSDSASKNKKVLLSLAKNTFKSTKCNNSSAKGGCAGPSRQKNVRTLSKGGKRKGKDLTQAEIVEMLAEAKSLLAEKTCVTEGIADTDEIIVISDDDGVNSDVVAEDPSLIQTDVHVSEEVTSHTLTVPETEFEIPPDFDDEDFRVPEDDFGHLIPKETCSVPYVPISSEIKHVLEPRPDLMCKSCLVNKVLFFIMPCNHIGLCSECREVFDDGSTHKCPGCATNHVICCKRAYM